MAQHLNDKQTAEVADLIKIRIPEEDLASYTAQLNTVLAAVEVMQEANTQDIPVTSQTHGLTNVLREDKPEKGLDIQEYPNKQNLVGNDFVVTKVI
jgi:aspartyl-tRNA(Asn)/glutamyl-tRNA(Gln) amidotransferase subunit C